MQQHLVVCSCHSTVPGKVPNVAILSIGLDSMNITWSPIPEQYRNGILLGYRVSYQRSCRNDNGGTVDVGPTNASLFLTNLLPGTGYGVEVAGFTYKGTGDFDIKRVSTSKTLFTKILSHCLSLFVSVILSIIHFIPKWPPF